MESPPLQPAATVSSSEASGNEEEIHEEMTQQPEEEESFVDRRVAKVFIDPSSGREKLYYGKVFEKKNLEDGVHWFIKYDDGDEEDMDRDDLLRFLKLYEEHQEEESMKKRKKTKIKGELTTLKKKRKREVPPPALFELLNIALDDQKLKKRIASILGDKSWENYAREVVHFFLFCYERQQIWVRRNAGKSWPWTENDVLRDNFFCNNYRALDRGTNYFRAQMLKRYETVKNQGLVVSQQDWTEQVLWAALCYRLMNKIETFEAFGKKHPRLASSIPAVEEWPAFCKFAAKRRNTHTIFTGAHQVMGWDKYKKALSSLAKKDGHLLQQTALNVHEAAMNHNLEGCFRAVNELNGCGPFFSWQVVCDLLECQCLRPCTEEDWAQLGPGAIKGIDIIFTAKRAGEVDNLKLARKLSHVQDAVYGALGLTFPKLNGEGLSLKAIEHALCEFSKYHSLSKKPKKSCGQRKYTSRSDLDETKKCQCGADGDDLLLCDFCLEAYCEDCVKKGKAPASGDCWKCHRCIDFEQMSFR